MLICRPDRQIPSVLSYVEDEEYHGAQAKEHLVRNPQNTVAYFRDFLGKKYVIYYAFASFEYLELTSVFIQICCD